MKFSAVLVVWLFACRTCVVVQSSPINATLVTTATPTATPTTPTTPTTPLITSSPSASPTIIVTTSSPTSSPQSLSPTTSPTSAATGTPTSSPAVASSPTSSPQLLPTTSPTVLAAPTASPLTNVLPNATQAPTAIPSVAPIQLPSFSPTQLPSSGPTSSPTSYPTNSPTNFPTPSPSASPTPHPTNSPTGPPTSSPTRFPTVSPTRSPTNYPTPSPTFVPTKSPVTPKPTTSPTTVNPTTSPTKKPTSSPTKKPTKAPTSSPTQFPTLSPTQSPSYVQQYIVLSDWTVCKVNCTAVEGDDVEKVGIVQFRNAQGDIIVPGVQTRNASCVVEDVLGDNLTTANSKTFPWSSEECEAALESFGGITVLEDAMVSSCEIQGELRDTSFLDSCQSYGVDLRRVFVDRELQQTLNTVVVAFGLVALSVGGVVGAKRYNLVSRVERKLAENREKRINVFLEEQNEPGEFTIIDAPPKLSMTTVLSRFNQAKLGIRRALPKDEASILHHDTDEEECPERSESDFTDLGAVYVTDDEEEEVVPFRSLGTTNKSAKRPAWKNFAPSTFLRAVSQRASAWSEKASAFSDASARKLESGQQKSHSSSQRQVAGMMLSIPDADGGVRQVQVVDPDVLPGWFKTVDQGTGKDYYFNQKGEVTWQHPIDYLTHNVPQNSNGVFALFSRLRKKGAPQQLNHFLRTYARRVSETHANAGWQPGQQVSSRNRQSLAGSSALPAMPEDNATDFGAEVSSLNGESSQASPSLWLNSDSSAINSMDSTQDLSNCTSEIIDGHSRESVEEAWFSSIDPESQDVYYYNTITNETTWDEPEGYGLPRIKKWTITSEDAHVNHIFDVDDERLLRYSRSVTPSDTEDSLWNRLIEQSSRRDRPSAAESVHAESTPQRRPTQSMVLKDVIRTMVVGEQELSRLGEDEYYSDCDESSFYTPSLEDAPSQNTAEVVRPPVQTKHVIINGPSPSEWDDRPFDQEGDTQSMDLERSTPRFVPPPPTSEDGPSIRVPVAPAPRPARHKVKHRAPRGNTVMSIWNQFEERNTALRNSKHTTRGTTNGHPIAKSESTHAEEVTIAVTSDSEVDILATPESQVQNNSQKSPKAARKKNGKASPKLVPQRFGDGVEARESNVFRVSLNPAYHGLRENSDN